MQNLCALMSLKQLFYSKNSLMACYLLPPLRTFSFLRYGNDILKQKLSKTPTVFPGLGSHFVRWNRALGGQVKWKVQENTAGGAKLLHTIYLDKWEKAAMEDISSSTTAVSDGPLSNPRYVSCCFWPQENEESTKLSTSRAYLYALLSSLLLSVNKPHWESLFSKHDRFVCKILLRC